MPHRLKDLLDRGRLQQDAIAERLSRQGNTLSAWLVLGNAGALVISVKPILDGSACAPFLRPVALAFAVGLLLTVAGMAVGYVAGLWSNFRLGKIMDEVQGAWIAETYIDDLERDGVEVPDNAPLRRTVEQHEKNMRRMQAPFARQTIVGMTAAFALTSLGSASFAVGLLRPLVRSDQVVQCHIIAAPKGPLTSIKNGEAEASPGV